MVFGNTTITGPAIRDAADPNDNIAVTGVARSEGTAMATHTRRKVREA